MPDRSVPKVLASKNSQSADEFALHSPGKTDGFSAIERQIERIKSTVPARLVEKADQVLLGLSHTGQSIPMLLKQSFNKIDGNPNDVIGRISRTVLEQAQSVRQTLAAKGAQLSEIADGVSHRVKSVNPFNAEEVASQPNKPAAKAKSNKPKRRATAKGAVQVTTKAVKKPNRAKASGRKSKD